jgi:tripartite-type tricarboxylate transporter receptor subunit TctC
MRVIGNLRMRSLEAPKEEALEILRSFAVCAGLALASINSGVALADGYPDHLVKIAVPYTPGGITDILGRLIADKRNQRLGQPFIVENRPGAAGMIGSDAVAKSAPDGYTLLVGSIANTIFPAVRPL